LRKKWECVLQLAYTSSLSTILARKGVLALLDYEIGTRGFANAKALSGK